MEAPRRSTDASDSVASGLRRRGVVPGATRALIPDRSRDRAETLVLTPDPLDEQEVAPPTASPHRVASLPGAKEISRNTVEALVFRALSTPLAFLLTVLQARILEPKGAGTYGLAILGVLLFSRLLSELGNAATKEVGEHDGVGTTTALALRLCLVFAPLGVLAAIAVGTWSVGLDLAVLAAVALVPNLVRQTLSGVLVGLSRIRLWNYLQVAPGILAFVGFIFFVVWPFDLGVEGAILAWALGHLVTGALSLAITREIWWPHLRSKAPPGMGRNLLRLALAMGAVNVILYVNYRAEFAVLEHFRGKEGDAEVGIYRAAVQVAESLWIITTAMATAIWTTVLHERDDRASSVVVRSCLKALLYTGAAAAALAVLAPIIVPAVFSEDFEKSVTPLFWLLPGIVAYGPVAILTIYLSVRRRRAGDVLIGPILSIVVTVGLSLILIPRYGPNGAAAAASAGYIVSALAFWVMFVRVGGVSWYGRGRTPVRDAPAAG